MKANERRGFILMECMMAVAIFAIGVLALGKCVENLLKAEMFRREDALAQRALTNYWAQIESGAIPLADSKSVELEGAWEGMKINMAKEPVKLMNEKEQELFGIFQVQLQLVWTSNGQELTRELAFMIRPKQQ